MAWWVESGMVIGVVWCGMVVGWTEGLGLGMCVGSLAQPHGAVMVSVCGGVAFMAFGHSLNPRISGWLWRGLAVAVSCRWGRPRGAAVTAVRRVGSACGLGLSEARSVGGDRGAGIEGPRAVRAPRGR